MLFGPNGLPVSSQNSEAPVRTGMQFDAFQLPNGAIISSKISKDFRNKIQNNTELRERLEKAQRMTGRKLIALDMQRNNKGMNDDTRKVLEKNQSFGEKVMKKRIKNENLSKSKD
jgi:hypothetical protein